MKQNPDNKNLEFLKSKIDVLIIIVCAILVYVIAAKYDVLEKIHTFASRHEHWELDEFVSLSIFLVIGLAFYSIRRWKDVQNAKTLLERQNAQIEKAYAVLEGIIESHKDIGIIALDNNLCYMSFNQTHREVMKQIWGADIALGHCMPDYITSPEERKKTKERLDYALSGRSFNIEDKYERTESEYRYYQNICNPIADKQGNIIGLSLLYGDITDRKRMEQEREKLIIELQESLAEIKVLSGLLPICASCKKIRDDKGYWNQIESYIGKHSDAQFSHGICPDCAKKFYADLIDDDDINK